MALGKTVFQPSLATLLPIFFGACFFSLFFLLWLLFFMPLVAIGIGLLVLFGSVAWGYWSIKNTFVELKEDGIQVRKGIIAKSQSLFLFSQIQDVSESQGIVGMILGIKNLSIKTMTAASAMGGYIGGLAEADANAIRDYALVRINAVALKKVQKENPKAFAKVAESNETEESLKSNPWPLNFFKAFSLPYAFFICILVLFVIACFAFPSLWGIFIACGLYIGLALIGWPIGVAITASAFSYRLGKTRLEIVSQFLAFNRSTIPFYKVQDVVILQSFFDKVLGLANVSVETGEMVIISSQNKNASVLRGVVPSLNFPDALALRKYVLDFISVDLKGFVPDLSKSIPLEFRKVLKKTVAQSVGILILVLFLAGLFFWFGWNINASTQAGSAFVGLGSILIILLIIGVVLTYVHQTYYLRSYYYNVSSDALIIRKGVIGSKEIVLPFLNIQNVFVDQDLWDRVFNLYDVHFSTVTLTSAFLSHIDGVSKENAAKIRDIVAKSMSALK